MSARKRSGDDVVVNVNDEDDKNDSEEVKDLKVSCLSW